MKRVTSILLSIRSLMKLYEQISGEVHTDYRLSQMEIKIITFLHNNPGKDTIGDIAELRMLPKGNVSLGVESLVQKSLLERTPDKTDRRKIHLSLTADAAPLAAAIEETNALFQERIFEGFTQEEILQYSRMNDRVMENAKKWLERK